MLAGSEYRILLLMLKKYVKIFFYCSHSTEEAIVVQRGKITCPRSHRQYVADLGLFNSRDTLPKKDLYGIAISQVS